MEKHLLLNKIYQYSPKNPLEELTSYSYDPSKGYWVDEQMSPLITLKNGPRPVSKKQDIETGEDQKGQ